MTASLKPRTVASRCADMRRSFDSTFAMPAAHSSEMTEDLLALRVGGDAYALRLSEVSGLHVNLHVVSVPGPAAHLLGIAAIHGVMAPIYDLAGLLGYPPAASTPSIAMIALPQPVGLALEDFEAHVRVTDVRSNIKEHQDARRARSFAREAVQIAGVLRPILQVSALIQLIREKAHDG